MARRTLTIKRIDPWSVLKFGSLANVAFMAIFLLAMGVVWFMVDRMGIVDQICGIATDVGFTQCGINAGNMFRALIMLGLLWVVVQTAVLVFMAFLHNLIADLTGGLVVGVVDEGGVTVTGAARPSGGAATTTGGASGRQQPVARSQPARGETQAMPPAGGGSGQRRSDSDQLFNG